MYVVCYDVDTSNKEGQKRLRKIAKLCENYGQRVQNSVFECELDGGHYALFKAQLIEIIKPKEDSLRLYNLGNKYNCKIEHFGIKESYDPKGLLLL